MTLAERTPYFGFHEEIVKHLPPLAPTAAILDLGCGTGAWLEALAGKGFVDLTGVDLDAAAFGCREASFAHADLEAEALPLPENHYQLITAIEVFEHLACPGALLRHAARHLRDDGLFVLTTPNIQSLEARLRYLLTDRLPSFDFKGEPSHVLPCTRVTLERLMAREGLAIKGFFGIPSRGLYRCPVRWVAAVLRPFLPETVRGISVVVEAGRCAS